MTAVEREYSDLDRWQDEETVRDMTASIEMREAFKATVQRQIDFERYCLEQAQARLAAHPDPGGER